jgi:hypothetical protein
MPISCRVSLRLIALVTRLHICRGENSSLSQLFDLDAWFFSSLFLGASCFLPHSIRNSAPTPPPPFFSVWHCQQSIWELAYIFSLIFLLNGKTSFFFILKFKNGRFVPVSGRSISITIKWREGKKKKENSFE